KYTPPEGHIHVTLRRTGDEATVEVRDDGNGIEPELLPRVFELFVQGSQDTDRSLGGLGLGLTLVRSLVMRHGGRVAASSPGPGGGSTFTVVLPVVANAPSAKVASLGPSVAVARRKRILIVDDNEDARDLLGEYLQMLGHEVRTASDGLRAIEAVRADAPDL